jgi:hypothetical protein
MRRIAWVVAGLVGAVLVPTGAQASPSAPAAACVGTSDQIVFNGAQGGARGIATTRLVWDCAAQRLAVSIALFGQWRGAIDAVAVDIDLDARRGNGCDGTDRILVGDLTGPAPEASWLATPSCDEATWTELARPDVALVVDPDTGSGVMSIALTLPTLTSAFTWFPYAVTSGDEELPGATYPYVFDGFEAERPAPGPVPGPAPIGYWMLGEGGRVHELGSARFLGEARHVPHQGAPASDIAAMPDGQGYVVAHPDGQVERFGSALALPPGNPHPNLPDHAVTSVSITPSGEGYWLFTAHGRVQTFGDAHRYGDLVAVPLNQPIIDSVATPSGEGYYLLATDGGVFSFGDAAFHGSTGAMRLNEPITGMAPDPDGAGYWLVAADGGVFAFDAAFLGSMGGIPLNEPVIGAVACGSNGYLMVGLDGGIFAFGDTPFVGSLGSLRPTDAIVAVAAKGCTPTA